MLEFGGYNIELFPVFEVPAVLSSAKKKTAPGASGSGGGLAGARHPAASFVGTSVGGSGASSGGGAPGILSTRVREWRLQPRRMTEERPAHPVPLLQRAKEEPYSPRLVLYRHHGPSWFGT